MRRTPSKTQEARIAFLRIVANEGGWTPGRTFPQVAALTGLTVDQSRDSVLAESADEWRRQTAEAILQRVNGNG